MLYKSISVFFLALSSVIAAEAAAPTYPIYVYPVIAKNVGLAGTDWKTEVCASNFSYDKDLPIVYIFIQESDSYYSRETLPPESTICYSDIVDEVLGLDSWQGALMVGADPDANLGREQYEFVTRVKVYNSTSEGTYGLTVAPEIEHFGIGSPNHFYYTDGSDDDLFVAAASGVENSGEAGVSGQRTSIGYFNAGWDSETGEFDVWQDVVFYVYDRRGNYLYGKERTVAPMKQAQFTLPQDVVVRGGQVQMHLLGNPYDYWGEPSEQFFAYITITDNRSGDGTYSPFRYIFDGGDTYGKSTANEKDPRRMIRKLMEKSQMIRRPTGRIIAE